MMGGRGSIVIGAAGRQTGFGVLEGPPLNHATHKSYFISLPSGSREHGASTLRADEPKTLSVQRFIVLHGRKESKRA